MSKSRVSVRKYRDDSIENVGMESERVEGKIAVTIPKDWQSDASRDRIRDVQRIMRDINRSSG